MTTTPRLQLEIPAVLDPGPGWASDLIAAFNDLDGRVTLEPGLGPTIFINPAGDDGNSGLTPIQAKATWQAAVDALDDGSAIIGKIQAYGGFGLTEPVVVGDGDKYVGLEIEGFGSVGLSGALSTCTVQQVTLNEDAFQFAAPDSKSHFLTVKGVAAYRSGSAGTGVGFNFAPDGGAQWISAQLESCHAQGYGSGFRIGGSILFSTNNCTANGNIVGWHTTFTDDGNSPNMLRMVNSTAMANTTGIKTDAFMFNPHFDQVCIQSNTDAGIEINGGMRAPVFTSCWWEFPGSDMIRLNGGTFVRATFNGCVFDGSGNTRHVFRNTGADAGSLRAEELTLIGCTYINGNGGKIMKVDNGDPVTSTDPGVIDMVIIGGSYEVSTGCIEGGYSATVYPNTMNWIIGAVLAPGVNAFSNSATPVVGSDSAGIVRFWNTAIAVGASTSDRASLNLKPGSAPSSPQNGDVWITSAGMFARIDGVTKTVTLT